MCSVLSRPEAVDGQPDLLLSAENAVNGRSEIIWLDLSDVLKGKSVPVIVDPEDPDDHYMDLSEWVHESEEA